MASRTVDKSRKSVDKSGPKSGRDAAGRFRKGQNGGAKGPAKGAPNAGRPPDEWKALCRELASRDEMIEKAKLVLAVPNHPAWLGAWKFVTEQGYGKPTQPIEASGEVTHYVVEVPPQADPKDWATRYKK